jgi:hypothetical protein
VGGRARGDRRWLSFCITEMKKASRGPDVRVVQGQSSHQGMAGEVPSRGYAIVMLGSSCFTRHALLIRVHHLLSSSKEKKHMHQISYRDSPNKASRILIVHVLGMRNRT